MPLGCNQRAAPPASPLDWIMKARRQVNLGQHDALQNRWEHGFTSVAASALDGRLHTASQACDQLSL